MEHKPTVPTITIRLIAALISAFIIVSIPFALFAQEGDHPLSKAPNISGGGAEPVRFYGNFCAGFGGVSLHDVPDQTFDIDLVGTPMHAYFVWSGRSRGRDPVSDNTIMVGINGSALQDVTPGPVTALAAQTERDFTWLTYAAEATAEQLAQLKDGSNTIRATGLTFNESHGVGLLVISEDLAQCPFQAVGLFFGNDVLYHGWEGTGGPNSEVTCFSFPPPPDRVEIDIQMFVGGVENPLRSNAIWAETGNVADQPDNLVGRPTATRLIQPLRGLSGDEFDNYDTMEQDPQPIIAKPGDTWACFQIESPPQPFPGKTEGISATWINLAVRVPVAEIGIEPDGVNPIGVAHTFTVTVQSAFGYPRSVVITPTVEPMPDVMTDTCDTPEISGKIARCTVTINSNVAGTFIATAEAAIDLLDVVAYVRTNEVRESSGPAIKVYETAPAIDIEKATNGEDADKPPGPSITIGNPVLWTYAVQNTGNVTLTEVTVTDNRGVSVDCPKETLIPSEVMICQATGTAEAGQYVNIGDVVGIDPTGKRVTDTDPSHYTGFRGPTAINDVDEPERVDDLTLFVPLMLTQ